MSALKQLKCDVCNSILKDNEMRQNSLLKTISSKNNMAFLYEGIMKKGDLCLKCAISINNHIQQMKLK